MGDGQPMVGVTVVVQGNKTNGAVTDIDGNSSGAYYVLCSLGMTPAVLETYIIFTGGK